MLLVYFLDRNLLKLGHRGHVFSTSAQYLDVVIRPHPLYILHPQGDQIRFARSQLGGLSLVPGRFNGPFPPPYFLDNSLLRFSLVIQVIGVILQRDFIPGNGPPLDVDLIVLTSAVTTDTMRGIIHTEIKLNLSKTLTAYIQNITDGSITGLPAPALNNMPGTIFIASHLSVSVIVI